MERLELFIVEVGVELKENDVEFESYYLVNLDMSLFDENIIFFTDKHKACEYINTYVKEGVENTYGFMWEVIAKVGADEIKEIKNYIDDYGYCDKLEDIYFPLSGDFDDTEYFVTKEKVLVDNVYEV